MYEGVGPHKLCNGLKLIFKLFVPPDFPGDLKRIIAILCLTVFQLMIPATFVRHSEIYWSAAQWGLLLYYKYLSLISLTKGTVFVGNALILDVCFSEIGRNTLKSFSKSETVHENN